MRPRIALLDSGVNAAHPHVREHGGVEWGPEILADGRLGAAGPQEDLIGHGTAVAAAILDLAPGCRLVSVKVFRDALVCPVESLARALEATLDLDVALVNLSLGSHRREAAELLAPAVARLVSRGVSLVAPASSGGFPSHPGALEGVVGVVDDPSLAREEVVVRERGGRVFHCASPFPRDLPGLDRLRNLHGVSFACANVTAHLARRLLAEG